MLDNKNTVINTVVHHVFVHVLLRDLSEAHHKKILAIYTGLVVYTAVYTDIHPGIGSVLGIGRYPEPRYRNRYREEKKGIGTSLVSLCTNSILVALLRYG